MKKSKFDPIYTRDEAADIVEMFEKILLDNDISIPSPEDDERGPHGDTIKDLTEVVLGEFSGKT